MKTFFITRFSIFDPYYHGYQITRNNDLDTYSKKLHNKSRLNFKFEVFENITFNSVINQNNQDWEWHIYHSDKLPIEYQKKIIKIVDKNLKIKLFEVNNFNTFFKSVASFNYGESYATVRLDDDDAIHESYIDLLNIYSNLKGNVISFPFGKEFSFNNRTLEVGENCRKPNIAIGLAAINFDIYSCGDHSNIAHNYQVIYDLTPGMYMICCSEFSDTGRKRTPKTKFLFKSYINNKIFKFGYHVTKTSLSLDNDNSKLLRIYNNIFFLLFNLVLNILGYQILKIK